MVKLLGHLHQVIEDFSLGDLDGRVSGLDGLQLEEQLFRDFRLHLRQGDVVALYDLLDL